MELHLERVNVSGLIFSQLDPCKFSVSRVDALWLNEIHEPSANKYNLNFGEATFIISLSNTTYNKLKLIIELTVFLHD